ncbi:unnamed protein product [Camellia sinensis]
MEGVVEQGENYDIRNNQHCWVAACYVAGCWLLAASSFWLLPAVCCCCWLRSTVLILKDDDGNLEALKVSAGHVAANTIRLLIVGSQAGGLIGISGQNIEKPGISSGVTITVLAQSQLPLCASAHESDRVVQLSGDVSAVMKALEEIRTHLRTTNLAADYVTLEMMVSETIVGGLIGRCGSNISRIRSESGAAIKCYGVYGGKGIEKHRQIHISGSAQQ